MAVRSTRTYAPPLTPDGRAALSAVLAGEEATKRTAPVALPILPPDYAVTLNGTIATLTLPNGGVCAFDGRLMRGVWDEPSPGVRARTAAHRAARAHAAPEKTIRMPVGITTDYEGTGVLSDEVPV